MTEHETDQVVLAARIAVAIVHRRETGVVVQQQIILSTKVRSNYCPAIAIAIATNSLISACCDSPVFVGRIIQWKFLIELMN